MPGVLICGVFEDEIGICAFLTTATTLSDAGWDVAADVSRKHGRKQK